MIRLLVLSLLVAACATTSTGDPLAGFAGAIAGRYDNSAQFAGAPDDFKRPPVADGSYEWIDRQAATFTVVNAPAIGPHVIYVEWRSADGAISRQRLWSFRQAPDGARMDFYTFRDPAPYVGGKAEALAALQPGDLIGYGPACGLHVTARGAGAWDGRITPEECQIVARSGRTMGVDARVTVMPTGVLYEEAGVLADGGYAFRVPSGAPYDFRRTP